LQNARGVNLEAAKSGRFPPLAPAHDSLQEQGRPFSGGHVPLKAGVNVVNVLSPRIPFVVQSQSPKKPTAVTLHLYCCGRLLQEHSVLFEPDPLFESRTDETPEDPGRKYFVKICHRSALCFFPHAVSNDHSLWQPVAELIDGMKNISRQPLVCRLCDMVLLLGDPELCF
jgi:hypothetical protein